MNRSTEFDPIAFYSKADTETLDSRRVFISPPRYLQGPGLLDELGRYLSLIPATRVGLLMSGRCAANEGSELPRTLESEGLVARPRRFGGECSLEEIVEHAEAWREESVDCVIATGGGKCIDTGKAIADRLGCPLVACPTLASNDAPCSAVSILYSPDGLPASVESYPQNPAMVVVDTEVIAAAPARFLVAGIGDAMATSYEARVCRTNPRAINTLGTRPTLAAEAIAEHCQHTLFKEAHAAAAAAAKHRINPAFENVVEANTLLSGLGFENGGIAAAHAVARSLTNFPELEENYLHGEFVAVGTLVHLVLEDAVDEALRLARFFAALGLPIHFDQIPLDLQERGVLSQVVEGVLDFPFIGNMSKEVTFEGARNALHEAHNLGLSVADEIGNESYKRLHSK